MNKREILKEISDILEAFKNEEIGFAEMEVIIRLEMILEINKPLRTW